MDHDLISETLEALSDVPTAKKARRDVSTLRGIRGTPQSEIARLAAAVWQDDRPTLDESHALSRLFSAAWEDGLLAIALLAACVPDDPQRALDLGLDWLERVDDSPTADALGWFVLGPAFLATGADAARLHAFCDLQSGDHPAIRRAFVAMGLSFLPIPLEGCSSAALRSRHKTQHLVFVEEALSPLLHVLCARFVRDRAPAVQKVLRRVVRVWAKVDPPAVVAFEQDLHGALSKMIAAETKKARKR